MFLTYSVSVGLKKGSEVNPLWVAWKSLGNCFKRGFNLHQFSLLALSAYI